MNHNSVTLPDDMCSKKGCRNSCAREHGPSKIGMSAHLVRMKSRLSRFDAGDMDVIAVFRQRWAGDETFRHVPRLIDQEVRNMRKIIEGLSITTCFYFVTLWAAFALFRMIVSIPFDRKWDLSGTFIGLFMVTLPYLLYGLFARFQEENPARLALQVSVVTVLCERVSIYLLGLYYASNGYGNPVPLEFIRGEAAPYFTPLYIFAGGVCSVLLCVMAASFPFNRK